MGQAPEGRKGVLLVGARLEGALYEQEVSNKIPIMFALSTCPRCQRMKRFLRERGIEAVIVDVDLLEREEKKRQLEFVSQVNPRVSFPTLVVGELAVVGEDYDAAKEALEL
jgi:glutaredoxin-like protein NrdH